MHAVHKVVYRGRLSGGWESHIGSLWGQTGTWGGGHGLVFEMVGTDERGCKIYNIIRRTSGLNLNTEETRKLIRHRI